MVSQAETMPGGGADRGGLVLPLFPADSLPGVEIARTANPLAEETLGDFAGAVRISADGELPPALVIVPFDRAALRGYDPGTVRLFRVRAEPRRWQPVWDSGANSARGFVWAKLRRGELAEDEVLVPIALPRDRLVHGLVRQLARERAALDPDTPEQHRELVRRTLGLYLGLTDEQMREARRLLTRFELQTSAVPPRASDLERGKGATMGPVTLPGGASLEDFRRRLEALRPGPAGLPEERLLHPPELLDFAGPPWPLRAGSAPAAAARLGGRFPLPIPWWWCLFFSQNWWMYHADERHSGSAHGCSPLTSWTVPSLYALPPVPLGTDQVISIPVVVDGKIYVATAGAGSPAGTVYRIDLASGVLEQSAAVASAFVNNQGYGGFAASPAVVDGRIYLAAVDGRIHCLDAPGLGTIWTTNLHDPDPAQNQPVQQDIPEASCWTSPLVVNGKVYVGIGEGEAGAFSFVYCLDAATGRVIWLFCTDKFSDVANNSPNDIPPSVAAGVPPNPFKVHATDPPIRGASVWSSPVYHATLNQIYVGTGNPDPDHALPNEPYSSGIISLDADTGEFKAFFQPDVTDSYRGAQDSDVDMPSSPHLLSQLGTEAVCIGSKNGSIFLLSPTDLSVLARRQLLPYYNDDPATPIPNVDPHSGPPPPFEENYYGMFGTAAYNYDREVLFAGVGGYGGGIDSTTTPFVRAMRWDQAAGTLADAWPTMVDASGVRRYTLASLPWLPASPLYQTSGEAGLSSPAVVNDVVFVSTSKPALYAFDAQTGICLWEAGNLPSGFPGQYYVLGAAIYGGSVVTGCGSAIYIYRAWPWWFPFWS